MSKVIYCNLQIFSQKMTQKIKDLKKNVWSGQYYYINMFCFFFMPQPMTILSYTHKSFWTKPKCLSDYRNWNQTIYWNSASGKDVITHWILDTHFSGSYCWWIKTCFTLCHPFSSNFTLKFFVCLTNCSSVTYHMVWQQSTFFKHKRSNNNNAYTVHKTETIKWVFFFVFISQATMRFICWFDWCKCNLYDGKPNIVMTISDGLIFSSV